MQQQTNKTWSLLKWARDTNRWISKAEISESQTQEGIGANPHLVEKLLRLWEPAMIESRITVDRGRVYRSRN
jgi:hypothetical protein